MAISLQAPDIRELKPHITVFGVGGAGGNAVNNMIESGLQGVDFVVANTDAQALTSSKAQRIVQMGVAVTEGLGAGSQPEVGCAAAEEVIDEIRDQLAGAHMAFITAGMGGGTGTGAAPVIARAAREMGILTVGVVTKPFQFEGARRMRLAEAGILELQQAVDTLIVIPNQNLFRVANEKTTFADAFAMADQVLYSGVACITDLMVKEGLINLDFADVRAIMRGMGKAMMGTGEATGEGRAMTAAAAAIANPLLDDVSMRGARGLLISITGGPDLTLYEVDEAATRIREEVDCEANIILGATFDESLEGVIRVSVVATGIDHETMIDAAEVTATEQRIAEVAERLRAEARARAAQAAAQRSLVEQPAALVREPAKPVNAAPNPQEQALRPVQTAAPTETAPVSEAAPAPAPQPGAPAPIQAPALRAAPSAAPVEAATPAPAPAPVFAGPAPVAEAPSVADASPDAPFLPPQAERAVRAPRMPRVDELPIPAQAEIRAHQERAESDGRRVSLLQRLATVGFGRREPTAQPGPVSDPRTDPRTEHRSEHRPEPMARPESMAEPAPRAAAPAPVRPAAPAMSPGHAEYAKRPQAPQAYRPAHGNLDPHGRPVPAAPAAPAARGLDDEQLEIPAFLRRQAT